MSKLLVIIAAMSLILRCVGCGRVPYVDARWKGTIVSVTITDHKGRDQQAAALEIHTGIPNGPRLSYELPDELVTDRPLMARKNRRGGISTINPESVPVGSFVEVTGRMMVTASVYAPDPDGGDAPFTLNGDAFGHIIIMHAKPRILTR